MKKDNERAKEFFDKNPQADKCYIALGKPFLNKEDAQRFLRGIEGQKPSEFTREKEGDKQSEVIPEIPAAPVEEKAEEAATGEVTNSSDGAGETSGANTEGEAEVKSDESETVNNVTLPSNNRKKGQKK